MNTCYCLKCQITVNAEKCIQCGDETKEITAQLRRQIERDAFEKARRRWCPAIRMKSGGRETRV